jgi:hypothetical protein
MTVEIFPLNEVSRLGIWLKEQSLKAIKLLGRLFHPFSRAAKSGKELRELENLMSSPEVYEDEARLESLNAPLFHAF